MDSARSSAELAAELRQHREQLRKNAEIKDLCSGLSGRVDFSMKRDVLEAQDRRAAEQRRQRGLASGVPRPPQVSAEELARLRARVIASIAAKKEDASREADSSAGAPVVSGASSAAADEDVEMKDAPPLIFDEPSGEYSLFPRYRMPC